MNKTILPSEIRGEVRAPSSKSIMQRSIAAGLLAEGNTLITNPSFCDDALAALRIAGQLGAEVRVGDRDIAIRGGFNPREELLDCGESGLGIRMFAAIASLHHSDLVLTGSGSLVNRPLSMIEKPLRELGVQCETNHGFIPVRIRGPLKGGMAPVDGSTSSQFLTGLLMALPLSGKDSLLTVNDLQSRPYIDLTIKVLRDFNVIVENHDYKQFHVRGNQKYNPREYEVEGDWSGAAFLLVAGAIGGKIRVTGIRPDSTQADRHILDVLRLAGAGIVIDGQSVEVTNRKLDPFRFDATESPDLFPPLVALAAHCEGISVISGTNRLLSKESNRAEVLLKEFSGLGIRIKIENNDMIIQGGSVKSGTISSSNDHRIAMAAAITGIRAAGKIEIEGYECISKSYPDFFNDFLKIGGIANE
ncbi:MAG: 3-phosphoshikimate 1-carboxyvinyltransferase [Bacteroidales bacterium]|nr:MAG: 3-phosphoshikimate 1-carboxyvinyltransferase [Bacteroidales bacterium]